MFNKKARFILVLGALLGGGFMATSLVGYFVARDSLTDQIAESTLPLTSDNVYSEIQQDLLRPIFISSLMAQDTFLRDWVIAGERDSEQIIKYLKEIQDRYGTVTSFFVSEKTRNYYHPTGINRKVTQGNPEDRWYFRVRKMTEPFEVNVDADQANNYALTVFINYRVYDYDGNFIGVTGVGLAVEAVKKLIETYQKRYGRAIYFVDREGQITLRGRNYAGGKGLRDESGLAPLATQILTSPSGSYTFKRKGKTVFLNSRLVSEFDWFLIVEQEDDPASTKIITTLRVNLLISLGITLVVLFLVHIMFRGYQGRLESMASSDSLTGAITRRALDQLFEQTVKAMQRRTQPMSVILFDLDKFKRINDVYGHMAGDEVLRAISDIVRNKVRDSDILCRWGGEEFLILLPECDLESAYVLAEKARADIEKNAIKFKGGSAELTASFGVAEMKAGESQDDLIGRADSALYAAKEGGRNRVARAP